MDIDLLSKMVKELILDNDAVTLPGIGSFVAEVVPSSFSDKGYTIHPPYRRLLFSPREGGDTLLVDAYCSANDASPEDATRILVDFLSELKERLKEHKSMVFPGLGKLRATRENHFFFVADEDLDIYPAGFGLESVSLKSHIETPEEVSAAIAGLKAALQEAPGETAPASAETLPETAPEPAAASVDEPAVPLEEDSFVGLQPSRNDSEAPAKAPRHGWRRFWRTLLVVLFSLIALAALAVIAFILLDHFAPQWVDRLLYNSEQLKILYY